MTTQRKREPHKCSACGRRTYRRRRRMPVLGVVDDRCQLCVEHGFVPDSWKVRR